MSLEARGEIGPQGVLSLRVIKAADLHVLGQNISVWPSKELSIAEIGQYGQPQRGLSEKVNAWRKANQRNLRRGLPKIMLARLCGIPHFYGRLYLTVIRANGDVEELGLVSMRIVTTAGVRFICDDFNNSTTDVTNMKFHGLGTGATGAVVGDTALQTELTTQYLTDNVRPTGTQASATVSTNATYTTVGTITVDAAVAATEWGLLSQAATGGGTLFDRFTFSVVNLANGDSLQSTFVLTMNSGS